MGKKHKNFPKLTKISDLQIKEFQTYHGYILELQSQKCKEIPAGFQRATMILWASDFSSATWEKKKGEGIQGVIKKVF